MTDIVERLRERRWAPDADHILDEAADEIERLRVDLLKAEMKAELDDLEDVGRLVAIGRREGIEAAITAVEGWSRNLFVGDAEEYHYGWNDAIDNAAQSIRALLTEANHD